MSRGRWKRRVLGGVTIVALLAGGEAAYGYWASEGAGSTSAHAGTMQTVEVAALVAGDAPNSTLIPGGPPVDVIVRINNPNPFSVQLHAISSNGEITADSGHSSCTVTGVTFDPPPAPIDPPLSLPPGQTLVHLPGAATMSTSSPAACQGATFQIPIIITARR